MRKSRQTSKTKDIEIQDDSEWANDRVWAKEVQFDPGSGGKRMVRKGCQRRVVKEGTTSLELT